MASASQLLNEYKKYDVNAYAKAIEDEYNKRTNYNKDLIEQQNALRNEQVALPAQLRDEYYASPIRNALAQESLIAGRQANVGSQLGSVTDLLNARGQQYNDILGKATAGYQDQANNLWRMYETQNQNEQNAASRAAQREAQIKYADLLKAQKAQNYQKLLDNLGGLRSTRSQQNIEGTQLDQAQRQALDFARANGLNLSNEDIWNLLGNTIQGYQPSSGYAKLLKEIGYKQ